MSNASKVTDFIRRLSLMHAEAGQIGLFHTMHKVHEAVQMVGWEFAGDLPAKARYDAAKKSAEYKARFPQSVTP